MKAALVACFLALAAPAWAERASVYDEPQGIACGPGRFNPEGLTVAHKSLPCGTIVEFRRGSRVVVATVNDRGPYVAGRTWDLAMGTARLLGFTDGVENVQATVLRLGKAKAKHHRQHRHHRRRRR